MLAVSPAQCSEGHPEQPCPQHGRALTCSLLSLQEGEQVLPGSLLPYYCALQVLLGMQGGYRLGGTGGVVAARLGPAGQNQPLEILVQAPVSCSDGAGRTGTYILVDMVLNRMAKGRCRAAQLVPCLQGGGGVCSAHRHPLNAFFPLCSRGEGDRHSCYTGAHPRPATRHGADQGTPQTGDPILP